MHEVQAGGTVAERETQTLAEMIANIRSEPENVCRMPDRIAGMAEENLKIYVHFLEQRHNKTSSRWMREGTEAILEEARKKLCPLQVANSNLEETQHLWTRQQDARREYEERDLVARNQVVEAAKRHCRRVAETEVRQVAEDRRRAYRMSIVHREHRARRIRRLSASAAAVLTAAAVACAFIASMHAAVAALAISLAVLLVFLATVLCAVGRRRALANLAPWRDDQEGIQANIERRAEDLLTKWENEQRRLMTAELELWRAHRREIRTAIRHQSHNGVAVTRLARAKQAATETRSANARRRVEAVLHAKHSTPPKLQMAAMPAPAAGVDETRPGLVFDKWQAESWPNIPDNADQARLTQVAPLHLQPEDRVPQLLKNEVEASIPGIPGPERAFEISCVKFLDA